MSTIVVLGLVAAVYVGAILCQRKVAIRPTTVDKVLGVGYSVPVVVPINAPIFVLEAIDVFWFIRASV